MNTYTMSESITVAKYKNIKYLYRFINSKKLREVRRKRGIPGKLCELKLSDITRPAPVNTITGYSDPDKQHLFTGRHSYFFPNLVL